MSLTHLDLFSGIGGFALAARWAGLETIGFSEIDPYACRVLEKNFPGVPNYGDIHKITAGLVDAHPFLLTGGFPCQPYSVAGKRRGAADDRHLWPEMARVIAEVRRRSRNPVGNERIGFPSTLSVASPESRSVSLSAAADIYESGGASHEDDGNCFWPTMRPHGE